MGLYVNKEIFVTIANKQPDPAMFRAQIIRRLAEARPDLCNGSGVGFWPIPAMIPVVLAKCIYLLHEEWLEQIKASNPGVVEMLSQVRTRLTHLVAEGDLGEDHAGIYRREHPDVSTTDIRTAPFFKAYTTILAQEDAFVLLGFVYSIETGSLEAIKTLVEKQMIRDGEFARLHLVEEVEHGRIADEIEQLIMDSQYAQRFIQGRELHNHLYEAVVA